MNHPSSPVAHVVDPHDSSVDPVDAPGMGGIGRRRFIAGVGAAGAAGVITASMPAGVARAAVPTGASRFVPLPSAVRVVDTREANGTVLSGSGANVVRNEFTRVDERHIRRRLAGQFGVADNATAIVATVTGVNFDEPNWIACFPSGGSVPLISNLNLFPWAINANLVTVKVGSGGQIDIAARRRTHMIVDVVGYFEPVDAAVSAGRFVGLGSARRAIDTRNGAKPTDGSTTTVDLTGYVPADASSVFINLTATDATRPGFLTAYSATRTSLPSTSNVNFVQVGETRASAAVVAIETVGGRRQIKVYCKGGTHFIVDVTGYYTSEASSLSETGLFVPVDPVRILDTRNEQIGRLWPQWVVDDLVPSPAARGAAAIVVNLTGAETRGPGYLTMFAARTVRPPTSNVNFSGPFQVVPNLVVSPITATHGYSVFSSHGAHVIVDYAGYFTGTPKLPQLSKYVNPAPPTAAPPWVIRIPRLGLTHNIVAGHPNVVDAGFSWHWTGTGYLGQNAHVSIFGHRTEAGSPYRWIHNMVNGDTWTVTAYEPTATREFTYRMVRRDLTDAQNVNILAATRFHPGTTMSIVVCTRGHDSSGYRARLQWFEPTSLKYRMVVTGELVSWREI